MNRDVTLDIIALLGLLRDGRHADVPSGYVLVCRAIASSAADVT